MRKRSTPGNEQTQAAASCVCTCIYRVMTQTQRTRSTHARHCGLYEDEWGGKVNEDLLAVKLRCLTCAHVCGALHA